MALKDLLVCVGDDPACGPRVDLAGRLCTTYDAHLTGLYVLPRPVIPGYVAAQLPAEALEMQDRQLREMAARAEALFRTRAERSGAPHEWRTAEGELAAVVMLHARYADLTIAGQGLDLGDAPPEMATLPEQLVLGVGRPVLVVPRYGAFPTVGQQVLVAWNGTREATRAVNDALPFLARAQKVIVLRINPPAREPARIPGADIALHLARHGVHAEAASTRATDLEIGDVILSYAADLSADLIVMGAYGHSRLRETILGGATQHLLRHMTAPVLMSH